MKTVSKYLFELLKPRIEQLICVAETSIDVMLKEYPVFFKLGSCAGYLRLSRPATICDSVFVYRLERATAAGGGKPRV